MPVKITFKPKPATPASPAPSAPAGGGDMFSEKDMNKTLNSNEMTISNPNSYVKKALYKSYPIMMGLKCDKLEVQFYTTFTSASHTATKVLNALRAAEPTNLIKFTLKEKKYGVYVIWGFAGKHYMLTAVVKAHPKTIHESFCAAHQAVMVKSAEAAKPDATTLAAAALLNKAVHAKPTYTAKTTITFTFSPAVLDSFSLDGKDHESTIFNAVNTILGWPEVLDECPLVVCDDVTMDIPAVAANLIVEQPHIRMANKNPKHNTTYFGAGKSKNGLKLYSKTHAMLDKFLMDLKGPTMARIEATRRHRPPVVGHMLHQLPNPLAEVKVFELDKARAILAASPNPYQQSLAKAVDWENEPHKFTLKVRAVMDKYQKKLLWKALESARHTSWNMEALNYHQQMLGILKANKVSRRMLGLDKLPATENPA